MNLPAFAWLSRSPRNFARTRKLTPAPCFPSQVQVTELDISIYPWEKNRRTRRPDESDAYTPELQQRQAEQ